MKTIYLTKGHNIINGTGTGAISPYGDEAIEAKKLVIDIAKCLWKKHNIMTYTESDQWSLRKVISWLKARLTFSKIAIDFHFNSHIAQKATGVEVIIPKHYNSKELKLAKELAEIISDTLGIKKRRGRLYYHNNIPGVKTENESQYKRIGILSKVQGINILIETCFISNPYDMIKYRDYYDELVNNIATIIAKNY